MKYSSNSNSLRKIHYFIAKGKFPGMKRIMGFYFVFENLQAKNRNLLQTLDCF
jgi:hypothetical protein